jgi:hypothetical protein
MTLPSRRSIRLSESFPCGIVSGDTICGRPATAAYADPVSMLPGYQQLGLTNGQWVLLPVCTDCAKAMWAVYQSEAT